MKITLKDQDKFRFLSEEKGKPCHKHLIIINGEWVERPGATSVSGQFGDDGWKYAWPPKLMAEKLREIKKERPIEDADIETAKNAWRQKRDKSADWGTRAHEWIEQYIKTGKDTAFVEDKEVMSAIGHFLNWEQKYKPEWIFSEIQVGSLTHEVCAILDSLCVIDGRVMLLDFKTSQDIWKLNWNKTKREHLKEGYVIQLAGIMMMLEEMGCNPDGRAILHIPKTNDAFEYVELKSDLEFEKECFIAGTVMYKHNNLLTARLKAFDWTPPEPLFNEVEVK